MQTIRDMEVVKQNEMVAVENLPIKYDTTDSAIAQLKAEYAPLVITDKASYKAVVAAISDVRGRRTAVEARRKELKAGALEYGRKVDARAKGDHHKAC